MTRIQVLVSIALAWHVAAMVVGAIPSLDDFGTNLTTPRPPHATLQSRLTAVLDDMAVEAVRAHRFAVAVLAPVRPPLVRYLELTDQSTRWDMFSRPSLYCEYVRFDYVFRSADGTDIVESDLVFPDAAPGEWRLVEAYFASFVDKAFANGAQMYFRQIQDAERAGVPASQAAMAADLQPFLSYYADRRRRSAPRDLTLERVEYWRGWAAAPAPGAKYESGVMEARQAQLERLGQPGGGNPLNLPSSDITWRQWYGLAVAR